MRKRKEIGGASLAHSSLDPPILGLTLGISSVSLIVITDGNRLYTVWKTEVVT